MIVGIAFLIGVAALFLYAAVADVLRQIRRHRRIARAHEPRPFRCLDPRRCGSDGKTCLRHGCSFGGR